MLCVVYLLRRPCEKLSAAFVKSRPHPGWLHFGQDSRKAHSQTIARLFKDKTLTGDLIAPLIDAHVKKIEREGMLIYG